MMHSPITGRAYYGMLVALNLPGFTCDVVGALTGSD